jgi:hypothetical protein
VQSLVVTALDARFTDVVPRLPVAAGVRPEGLRRGRSPGVTRSTGAALWLLVAASGSRCRSPTPGCRSGQAAFVRLGASARAARPGGAGLPLGVRSWRPSAGRPRRQLVARGASRLEGAYLALATWALAWLVHRTLTAFPGTFGGEQGLVRPSPARLVSPALGPRARPDARRARGPGRLDVPDRHPAAETPRRGPAGLDLAALREGPALAASLGVPVAARRRAVLTATAALGALSGAGTAVLLGLVAPADVSPLLSLQLFVAVLVAAPRAGGGPCSALPCCRRCRRSPTPCHRCRARAGAGAGRPHRGAAGGCRRAARAVARRLRGRRPPRLRRAGTGGAAAARRGGRSCCAPSTWTSPTAPSRR